jgi:rubrerythrin
LSNEAETELQDALRVLRKHYRRTIKELAHEILENGAKFDEPARFGGPASEINERYAERLSHLATVYHSLEKVGPTLYKEQGRDLAEDEFLCLACRTVIKREQNQCPKCGWRWQPGRAY